MPGPKQKLATSASSGKYRIKSVIRTILLAGFVAGTMDITGAIVVYCYIIKVLSPLQLLQGIASGVFGERQVSNDIITALIGLGFHYIIAFCWTIGFFIVFPYIKILRKYKIISGLSYGVFVWFIMNCVVLPLSNVHHHGINIVDALIAAAILMLCIGLPISLITNRYYQSNIT